MLNVSGSTMRCGLICERTYCHHAYLPPALFAYCTRTLRVIASSHSSRSLSLPGSLMPCNLSSTCTRAQSKIAYATIHKSDQAHLINQHVDSHIVGSVVWLAGIASREDGETSHGEYDAPCRANHRSSGEHLASMRFSHAPTLVLFSTAFETWGDCTQ